MVDKVWVNPNLPRKLYEELDNYARSEEGQKLGFLSAKDIIVVLMRDFLDKTQRSGIITLVDSYDKKIILRDSIKGTILVEIDENNKLQCHDVQNNPHDNRYVTFCLKSENLWNFLKKNNVKLVVPRMQDKD